MSDWIDNLARLAEAATPGPWSADGYGSGQQVTGATGTIFADTLASHEDAEFIAAANPTTILRLIKQAQNYNAEADRHASRVVAMEAENEDLTAEAGARALEDAADEFEAIEQRYAIVHSPVAWLRERADRTRDGAR